MIKGEICDVVMGNQVASLRKGPMMPSSAPIIDWLGLYGFRPLSLSAQNATTLSQYLGKLGACPWLAKIPFSAHFTNNQNNCCFVHILYLVDS